MANYIKKIPPEILTVLKKINNNGYESYIVGGASRNLFLNLPVVDWDITTNALPSVIESLFDKTIPIGRLYGTITVVINNINIEVTTYRKDIGYSDNRKPDEVVFTNDINEDILRRDFTMNTMLIDSNGNLKDLLKGKISIEKKLVETVGDPFLRFNEDYLRVYRYVRFTNTLGFFNNKELDELIENLNIPNKISVERIRSEFNKILLSKKPSLGIRHLKKLNLIKNIIPELEKTYDFLQHSKFHHLDVFEHTMEVLDNTDPIIELRLAALLHDIGKPKTFELINGEGHFYGHDKKSVSISEEFLKRLKYPNALISKVITLVKNHMRLLDSENKKSIKKFINKIGENNLENFLKLRKADILGSKTNDNIESVDILKITFEKILNDKEPMSVKDLNVNGYDLIKLGYEGAEIGIALNELLELVLECPDKNSKAYLLNILKE